MKKNGFTLIELLVVIAIIALLASIILTSLNISRLKSRDARRISDIKEIQLGLALFYNDNGYYPNDIYEGATQNWSNYMSVVPTDPSGGGNYAYAALGSGALCNNYHLGAVLEDSTNVALGAGQSLHAAAGTKCTSSTHSDFSGNTKDCNTTAGPPVLCYDVKAQ